MRRPTLLFLVLIVACLSLIVSRPARAQATPPIPPNPNALPILTAGPAAATFANGRVLLNGSVILDPQTEAPGCFDTGEISYAPTGDHFLVLLNCIEGDNDAFIFRTDGSDKRRITTKFDYVNYNLYAWSPDGRWLLYQRVNSFGGPVPDDAPRPGMVRYSVVAGEKVNLLGWGLLQKAKWSLDSRYVAFAAVNGSANQTEIYLLRADGTGLWELQSIATADANAILSWGLDATGVQILTYVSPLVSTEVEYQISEQSMSSLGQGWQSVAPLALYYVTGVASNDVLNMRSGPGVNNGIVYRIPPYAGDVMLTGQAQDVGASHWAEVTYDGITGWVNRKFLLPQLPADAATPISVRVVATG